MRVGCCECVVDARKRQEDLGSSTRITFVLSPDLRLPRYTAAMGRPGAGWFKTGPGRCM